MNETSVVMCTYHRTLSGDGIKYINTFKDQNFPNFELLFDNQMQLKEEEVSEKYGGTNVCVFDDAFFAEHNFNRPINRGHRWGSHQNPKYFYAHFRMLSYYIKRPNYKYYWFFDDDVHIEGDLKGLLNDYESYTDDFVAIQAFKKENYPELDRVSIVSKKMQGSGGNWMDFAPGPGDNYKSLARHMGSFFPMVRFSNRALAHLLDLNKQGFFGYSEGFVPTSLASDGFYVSSILDEDDKYFIKTDSNCIITHKGMKFTWKWI
jgi:hypothetical protein